MVTRKGRIPSQHDLGWLLDHISHFLLLSPLHSCHTRDYELVVLDVGWFDIDWPCVLRGARS